MADTKMPAEMTLDDFIADNPSWTEGRMAAWTTYFQDALRNYEHARGIKAQEYRHTRACPPHVAAAIYTLEHMPRTLWEDVKNSVRETRMCLVFDEHRLLRRLQYGGEASPTELVLLAAQLLQVLRWASGRTTDAALVWDRMRQLYLPVGTKQLLGYGPPVRAWRVYPGTLRVLTPGECYDSPEVLAHATPARPVLMAQEKEALP